MDVTCNNCMTTFAIDETKLPDEPVNLRCSNCEHIFEIVKGSSAPVEEQAVTDESFVVLIATEETSVAENMKKQLADENVSIISVRDGIEALDAVGMHKPGLAVLDVALPNLYGFEVCEHIKNNEELKDTKVFLLASIYDKNRYRRAPSSLYGADEYLERHHLGDYLIDRIKTLVAIREGRATADSIKAPLTPDIDYEASAPTLLHDDAPGAEPPPLSETPQELPEAEAPSFSDEPTQGIPGSAHVAPPLQEPTPEEETGSVFGGAALDEVPPSAQQPPEEPQGFEIDKPTDIDQEAKARAEREAYNKTCLPEDMTPEQGEAPNPYEYQIDKPTLNEPYTVDMLSPDKRPSVSAPAPKIDVPAPAQTGATVAPPPASAEESQEEIAAKKLARIIVSDIMLYNIEEVDEGLRKGNIFSVLEDDVRDGLKFIRKRVPEHLPAEQYLKEALEVVLKKKKEELGL